MPLNNPGSGATWASEYLVSGLPFCTSSTCTGVRQIIFGDPLMTGSFVTQWFVVTNESAAALRVGFTQRGLLTTSNYIELETDESISAELRVKELWLSGSGNTFQLLAGLTGIYAHDAPDLSSSLGNPGVG